jgi:pyruvate formate lyase activating enzyme
VNNCAGRALAAEGEMMDIEKVVHDCLQDIDFYEESGGGVTLSGGECMCQPEFSEALIKELKKHNIHVAAETTGYIDKETFRHLAPLFDLLLFDVKQYDTGKHFKGTGVHNELIIENLAWAHEQGLNVLPRIPVIPRFNATLADAAGIADLLVKLGFDKAQLLPFHQMGERKYELLGRDYSLKDEKALYPENLGEYRQVFIEHGINASF